MRRRNLLSLGASLALGTVTTSAAAASPFGIRLWDVVIVGSGLAGLSAAVSARENGAENVLVIEKLPILGGHSRVASGSFCAVSEKRLKPYGIKTTVEDAVKESLVIGGPEANAKLLKILMKESESAMDWLESMGVRWNPEPYLPVGSLSVCSFISHSGANGLNYITHLNQRARELGVRFIFSHRVNDLLTYADRSAVEGVVMRTPEGNVEYIRSKAVILACGGFTGNISMCRAVNRNISPAMRSTANPTGRGLDGATGDAISLAKPLNAMVKDLEHIQLICYLGGRMLNYSGADIYVNQEGRRFVNEANAHAVIQKELLKQPNETLWAITDAKSKKSLTVETKLEDGSVYKCADTAEIAKLIGCPAENIEETLNRYNEFVRCQKDEDFAKPILLQTIDKPPYYIGREKLGIHYCCGGLAFNEYAEVLRNDGTSIAGLYAAGEATGGLHGKDRIGGGALTECVVFGRIAGKEAANFKIG